MLKYILIYAVAIVGYIVHEIDYLNKPFKPIELSSYDLLVGYNRKKPIIANMLNTPHLLITGLSGQGKSKCLKAMLSNLRGANIVLCNAFREDYVGVQAKKLYGENFILAYISLLLENIYVREKPLYIVLEELGTIKNKKLIEKIQELLCIARHYNIFVIGVIQIATKEELKFKSYFNARCSFKQLDEAAYRVVLSTAVEEKLDKREFVLLSDNLYVGRTYTIN